MRLKLSAACIIYILASSRPSGATVNLHDMHAALESSFDKACETRADMCCCRLADRHFCSNLLVSKSCFQRCQKSLLSLSASILQDV